MPTVTDAAQPKLAGSRGGGPRDLWPDDPGGGGGDDGAGDGGSSRYIPDAGLFAMRFVLLSIATLFITLGVAYFARSRTGFNWQHIQVPRLLWVSTALILSSSWTLECARAFLERKNSHRYARWLELTLGIGLAFLATQLLALRELVSQGIYLRHNPHSSLFYVVTGAHGIHLLGGMAAMCYLLLRASLRPESVLLDFRRQRTRAAVTALYWHFLTLLWLGLFLSLLLWP
ncbi:MAG TPA: cytochrome c oxidase subunit 3 [Bryobacteraceae bacterium]|jgi:cytochrome c oxidase subunit 3|nr:cytochrome c oxidase subunit 3 [Bryobacteraceae bacterium]